MSLSSKVALVTGAAMGIGRAMSQELLKNGAKVALVDVNAGAGTTLVEALKKEFGKDKVLFIECDVQNEEQVKAAFQKTLDTFGGLDVVCNNAGVLNEAEWEKTVSVNLTAVIRVLYVALHHMNKQTGGRGGVIVNTASIAGLGPTSGLPVYTASKYGVIGFTRAMALTSQDSEYDVRINAICPAVVETELMMRIPERLGKFSHLKNQTSDLLDSLGRVKLSQVTDGLMELLLDETKNGQALIILPNQRKYEEFKKHIMG